MDALFSPLTRHIESARDSCLNKFLHCLVSSQSYKEVLISRSSRTGANNVSKIDKVSRYLFPASFFALMVTYAVAYM